MLKVTVKFIAVTRKKCTKCTKIKIETPLSVIKKIIITLMRYFPTIYVIIVSYMLSLHLFSLSIDVC